MNQYFVELYNKKNPLPTPQCAGYSVKIKKILTTSTWCYRLQPHKLSIL